MHFSLKPPKCPMVLQRGNLSGYDQLAGSKNNVVPFLEQEEKNKARAFCCCRLMQGLVKRGNNL